MTDQALKTTPLRTTPLTESHRAAGARMVPFAGYEMPVQYADGVLKEHLWTRAHCGLFDVSHMGPSFLRLKAPSGDPKADHAAIAALIEPLICGDIRALKRGQLRYTLLLNGEGGIRDDLMVGRPEAGAEQGGLYIVVNAGTKDADFAQIIAQAGGAAELVRADDRGLIAVQGPEAAAVIAPILPAGSDLSFMTFTRATFEGADVVVSRSGYTGDDGFEVLVPADKAARFWARLLEDGRAKAIGLPGRGCVGRLGFR